MKFKSRSVLRLRLAWVLSILVALAFFIPGLFLQAGKSSQGVLGIWMSTSGKEAVLVAVTPGLSADRAGLQPGDVVLSRIEKWNPETRKWINDITYHDRSGVTRHVIIEASPPEQLPFNLPASFYAAASALFDLLFFLVFLLVGTVIVWRTGVENDRSARRFALVAAFSLLLTAVRIPPETYLLLRSLPNSTLIDSALHRSGYIIFPLFLSLFPNGRWSPRRIWLYPLVGTVFAVTLTLTGWRPFSNEFWNGLFDLFVIGVGVAAQGYRYRRASTAQERQQTKWALSGIGAAFALYYLFQFADALNWTAALLPWLRESGSGGYLYITFWPQVSNAALLLVPITLAVSMLRYRLWDIDLLIRRTLAYTAVTSLLAGMYFILVVALQQIFNLLTGESSTLAIILSTLAISLLFTPVRRWVQGAVDRRFYRSQYNAAQTLERFSSTLRSEVDLDRLSSELVDVVEDSLHPEAVSLWVLPTQREWE